MRRNTFKIDPQQLKKILSSLRTPSKNSFNLDKFYTFVQISAIIVAGIWALREYIEFRSEHEKLILNQLKFQVEQQDIAKSQQELTVKSAELSLLLNEQSLITKKKELENLVSQKITDLQNNLIVEKIKSFQDGTNLYKGGVELELVNTGDEEFEITYSITQYFIGLFPQDTLEINKMIFINPPPDIFNYAPKGYIHWENIGHSSGIYGSTKYDLRHSFRGFGIDNLVSGRGVVANLRKGESSRFGYNFLFRSKPENSVAVVTNIGIDGAISGRDVWYFKKWKFLGEIDDQKSIIQKEK